MNGLAKAFAEIGSRDDARMRSADRIASMKERFQCNAEHKPHGTRMRYIGGCRCVPCRAANSRYECGRAAERKAGRSNGIVPAAAARAHLFHLSQLGVGRRAVADASDVAVGILGQVKSGKRLNIRKQTEERILAVSVEAACDRSYVPARDAWMQIRELLSEGFTKAELARRLGYKAPALQFREKRMTAANIAKVDRFYRQIMAE